MTSASTAAGDEPSGYCARSVGHHCSSAQASKARVSAVASR